MYDIRMKTYRIPRDLIRLSALSHNIDIDLETGNSKAACNLQEIAVLPEPESGIIMQQIKKPVLPLLVTVAPLDSKRG